MSTAYDAIVIGAGHNGLLCALDLARAGRRVLLLEAADHVGSAAATRSFAPGFQVSACAHLLHGLPQSLVQELNLSTHGLRFAATQISSYALDPAGGAIRMAGAQASGPGLSAGDVAAYASLRTRMGRYAGVFATLFSMTPPRLGEKYHVCGREWRSESVSGMRTDATPQLPVVGGKNFKKSTSQSVVSRPRPRGSGLRFIALPPRAPTEPSAANRPKTAQASHTPSAR